MAEKTPLGTRLQAESGFGLFVVLPGVVLLLAIVISIVLDFIPRQPWKTTNPDKQGS